MGSLGQVSTSTDLTQLVEDVYRMIKFMEMEEI